jgi:hypothetical protein
VSATPSAAAALAGYLERNAETQRLLRELVGGLAGTQLTLAIPDSEWTIGAALAHLGFWDRVHWGRLDTWERDGTEPSHMDADVVNQAGLPQWLALPGPAAARLAVEGAALLDARIAALPDWLVERISGDASLHHLLDRSRHRREHFDQIELTLRNCGC